MVGLTLRCRYDVFFFFQAEDGIRDVAVTGVQTCALPICEHPRMGAADVVPFIPLEGSTMEDCVVLARALGERVGRELEIPVFLYERAAKIGRASCRERV